MQKCRDNRPGFTIAAPVRGDHDRRFRPGVLALARGGCGQENDATAC